MTDADLNQNIKPQPHDWIVKKTILWMLPAKWGIRPNHITIARFIASPLVFWLRGRGEIKLEPALSEAGFKLTRRFDVDPKGKMYEIRN